MLSVRGSRRTCLQGLSWSGRGRSCRRPPSGGSLGRTNWPGGRAWDADTLVDCRSATKALAALCLHRLAERGEVEYDAPRSPLLAGVGVRSLGPQALSHHAGRRWSCLRVDRRGPRPPPAPTLRHERGRPSESALGALCLGPLEGFVSGDSPGPLPTMAGVPGGRRPRPGPGRCAGERGGNTDHTTGSACGYHHRPDPWWVMLRW